MIRDIYMVQQKMLALNRTHKASRSGAIATIVNYEKYQGGIDASAEAGHTRRTLGAMQAQSSGTPSNKENEYKEIIPFFRRKKNAEP